MFRKIFTLFLTISLIYILGSVAAAAPLELDPQYKGTAEIMNVTNPDDGVATFKHHVVVSVTGDEGVIVTLYTYNPETQKFDLYTDANGGNSWFVGPSGLFIKRLPITSGINYIGVFAELNGYDQFITRRVDRADLSIKEGLKNILVKKIEDAVQTMGN